MSTGAVKTPHRTSNDLRRDVLVIVAALACFWVVGSVGGATAAYFSTPRVVFAEQFATLYWLRWGAKIAGRFFGDFLCGVLLGRYLRRIRPWHVFFVIALFPLLILLANRFFIHVDDGRWLQSVGVVGAIVQLTLHVGAMLGNVALGIWLGQRLKLEQMNRST